MGTDIYQGATYGRLRFNVGPTSNKRLGIEIDYQADFDGTDHDAWLAEYDAAVCVHDPFLDSRERALAFDRDDEWPGADRVPYDWDANEWVAS